MIDRMSGRVSLLLVSVALILIVLLGWFVLIAPQRSKAATLDSQIGDTNVQLQAVTSLLEGPVGRQSLATLRASQTAVPDDAKMSQILRQLSAAAAKAGVELDGVTPQALIPVQGAEALPIGLTATGHYFAIQKFLKTLRSAAVLTGDKIHAKGRLYTVDSIQFTGGGNAASTSGQSASPGGLVAAAVALNAFVYDPTAVPATTTDTTTGAPTTTTTGP